MGLFVRTIGIARVRIKIGMANLAYNFQRLAWLEGAYCARLMANSGETAASAVEDQRILPN